MPETRNEPRSPRLVRKRDLIVKVAGEKEKLLLWKMRKKFDIEPQPGHMPDRDAKTFVALLNGNIVGFLQASIVGKKVVLLERGAVLNGMRFMGIGRLLLGKVEGYYIGRGLRHFIGSTSRAKGFFKKTGHRIINEARLNNEFEKKVIRKPMKARIRH